MLDLLKSHYVLLLAGLLSGTMAFANQQQAQTALEKIIQAQSQVRRLSDSPVCDESYSKEKNYKVDSVEITGRNSQKFKVSKVTKEQAQGLFKIMAQQEDIPFGWPEAGCQSRAHAMVQKLDELGISAGKIWTEGDLRIETPDGPTNYMQWNYHVAPFVMVEKDGKDVPFVLDPSIFNRAVTAEEWRSIQITNKFAYIYDSYMTPKYNFDQRHRDQVLTEYDPQFFSEMRMLNHRYLDMQKERQAPRK